MALIGLGSNLRDRLGMLAAAVRAVREFPRTRVVRVSGVYRTSPVGNRSQPWFYNAAMTVRTSSTAAGLLGRLKRVERALGRKRRARGGAREIDLDLLLLGSSVSRRGKVRVPHPRMAGRRFVLAPASEVAPGMVHPVAGLTVRGLLARLDSREKVVRLPAAAQDRFRSLCRQEA